MALTTSNPTAAILSQALGGSRSTAAYPQLQYQPAAPAAPAAAAPVYNTNSGGSAAPANPYLAQNNQVLGNIQNAVGQLNNLYNQIFGAIDQGVNARQQNIQADYQNQLKSLTNQYQQQVQQLPDIFARGFGLGNSTYETRAEDNANQTYQTGAQGINTHEQSDLASLGQYGASQKATYQAKQDYYNNLVPQLQNYVQQGITGNYQLANLLNQAQQDVVNTRGALAGFGPNSQFTGYLNSINPVQSNAGQALTDQLNAITKASVPDFAKQQIASGIINQATTVNPQLDTNYYLRYFQNANNGAI